jgi:hypothetical protein
MEQQAKPAKLGAISLPDMLASEGMEIADSSQEGNLIVRSKSSGKEFELGDKKKFAETFLARNQPLPKGVTIDNFDIMVNDPETAFETVPLDVTDRLKLSFGNVAGKKAFLEKKFDEVKANANGEITVRKGDSWHKIDADGLGNGDAWDKFAEFAGDAADWGGDAVTVIPSLAAAFSTSGLGAAAGAAVGSVARTSMGRFLDTYTDNPEEQLKDLALESFFGLGGYAVGKHLLPLAGKSLDVITDKLELMGVTKAISEVGEKAVPEVKDALASVLSFTTGVPAPLTGHMLKNPKAVNQTIGRLKEFKFDRDAFATKLRNENIDNIFHIAEEGDKAYYAKYKALQDQAVREAGDSVVMNTIDELDIALGNTTPKVLNPLDNTQLVAGDSIKAEGLMNDNVWSVGLKWAGGKNRLIEARSMKEIAKEAEGLGIDIGVAANLHKASKIIAGHMNAFKTNPNAKLKDLLNAERELRKIQFDSGLPEEYVKRLNQYLTPFIDKIESKIAENPNVGSLVKEMKKFYVDNKPIIDKAKQIRFNKSPESVEAMVNQLVSARGSNSFTKDALSELARHAPGGTEKLNQILTNEAATKFLPVLPQIKNLAMGPGLLLGGGLGIDSADGEINPAWAAAGALMSPRLMAKSAGMAQKAFSSGLGREAVDKIPAMYQVKEVMTRLSRSEKAKLLKDPASLLRILAPVMSIQDRGEE